MILGVRVRRAVCYVCRARYRITTAASTPSPCVVVQGVDAATGQLQLNFTNLDTVYDAIARAGMRPYVELDFMPGALANGSVTYLHYKANVTPPRNLTQWAMVRLQPSARRRATLICGYH